MDRKTSGSGRHVMFSVIAMSLIAALLGLAGHAQAKDSNTAILNQFKAIDTVASTVPANGDVNPYGVAQVKSSVGNLVQGHILVSNFNDSGNLQGTGTTIVDVAPDGAPSLFSQINPDALPGPCPGGVGLTTALVVLDAGWVVVGSLPTTDGTAATAQAGCLIVLDSTGTPRETFFGSLINGPWDMTAWESDGEASLFVTNVLNGTVAANGQTVNEGTVVRINLKLPDDGMPWIESMTVVGSGFPERTDPDALVIGPTGVGLSPEITGKAVGRPPFAATGQRKRTLYVADSLNNRIAAIPDALDRTTSAGTGSTLSSGGSLNDPLGLVVTPNGHILTVNGDDGLITEIAPNGAQIATAVLDSSGSPPGAGTLFGLAFDPAKGVYFVDDGTNTLNLFH